jgi:hypothetical protein
LPDGDDIEADDDALGGVGQEDVDSVMPPTAAWMHADLDLGRLAGDLLDLVLEHIDRALHVGLEHDEDLLDILVGHLVEHAVQRGLGLGELLLTLAVATLLGGRPRPGAATARNRTCRPRRAADQARDLHRHGRGRPP